MRGGAARLAIAGALLLLALLPAVVRSEFAVGTLVLIFFYAFLGQGWNILGGFAGQFSFGHAVFFGIGAYTSSLLFAKGGVTPWIGMWVGGVLAAIVGLFTGHLSFRYGLRGAHFALVMLAFAEMFRVAAINLDFTGGSAGVLVPLRGHDPAAFQFGSKAYFYYIALGLMVGSCALAEALRRSRIGYYWAAIREDEPAARVTGVDSYRYKLLAMAVSAFLTALGGTFYAQYFSYIDPGIAFGPTASVEILLRPIVGGPGTVLGPVVGAFLMGGLAEGTRGLVKTYSGVHLMLYGALLMLVITQLPRGVMGWLRERAEAGAPGAGAA